MTPDFGGVLQNLLTELGRLTMANMHMNSETYNGHRGCKEQNSVQLHTCLAQSITESVLSKLKAKLSTF
jgi:hypothetical protein